MGYLIAVAAGYLLGSSNLTYYISKAKNVDVRGKGTGNLGASNATILLGWWAGVAVAIHDAGKSLLAVLLARLVFPDLEYVGVAAGVASVLGHIFPFYLKFKGGKGFASFVGMTLALNWKLALAMLVLLVLITLVTDYLVLGTFSTIIIVPIAHGIMTASIPAASILLIATAVILYKHRENITRLRNGTEIGLHSAANGEHRVK